MAKSIAKFMGIPSSGRFMNKVREEKCWFVIWICQWSIASFLFPVSSSGKK